MGKLYIAKTKGKSLSLILNKVPEIPDQLEKLILTAETEALRFSNQHVTI